MVNKINFLIFALLSLCSLCLKSNTFNKIATSIGLFSFMVNNESTYVGLRNIVMEEEVWVPVKGFNGLYVVSNKSEIKSVKRVAVFLNKLGKEVELPIKEKIKLKNPGKNGYLTVALVKNGKTHTKTVHRIVAEAFIPNPHNKKCINHKNGDKHDNRLINLEWATHSENNKHAFDNFLKTPHRANININSEIISEILYLKSKKIKYQQISDITKIPILTVGSIIRGNSYTRFIKKQENESV